MRRWAAAPAWIGAVLLFLCQLASADVPVPALTARVTDLTGTLSQDETARLDRKLAEFESRKGSQIAVLIVPTTQPEAIEQYSMRVVEAWKLGRASQDGRKIDDGALLLIAKDDRKLRIEVGYGLEGALTDVTSARIIREVIVPLLKHGSFYAAIDAGIDRMMSVIDGEPLPAPDRHRYEGEQSWQSLLPFILVATIIVGPILRTVLGRVAGSAATGGLTGFVVWLLSALLGFSILSGIAAFVFTLLFSDMGGGGGRRWSNRGRYSDFGGGWSSGGSFGGGGFSGGGGSFGGGGASGSW